MIMKMIGALVYLSFHTFKVLKQVQTLASESHHCSAVYNLLSDRITDDVLKRAPLSCAGSSER